jgi:hypothetical protein
MRIDFRANIPQLDLVKFKAQLQAKLQRIVIEATREAFLKMAAAVPVDTGMAATSLVQPLGRVVRATFPINTSSHRQREGKTASAGAQQGRAEVIATPTRVSIIWTTRVLHFFINELFAIPNRNPGLRRRPWKILDLGKKTYLAAIRKIAKRELKTLRPFVAKTVR